MHPGGGWHRLDGVGIAVVVVGIKDVDGVSARRALSEVIAVLLGLKGGVVHSAGIAAAEGAGGSAGALGEGEALDGLRHGDAASVELARARADRRRVTKAAAAEADDKVLHDGVRHGRLADRRPSDASSPTAIAPAPHGTGGEGVLILAVDEVDVGPLVGAGVASARDAVGGVRGAPQRLELLEEDDHGAVRSDAGAGVGGEPKAPLGDICSKLLPRVVREGRVAEGGDAAQDLLDHLGLGEPVGSGQLVVQVVEDLHEPVERVGRAPNLD